MVYHRREGQLPAARAVARTTTQYRQGLRYTQDYYNGICLGFQCFCVSLSR